MENITIRLFISNQKFYHYTATIALLQVDLSSFLSVTSEPKLPRATTEMFDQIYEKILC